MAYAAVGVRLVMVVAVGLMAGCSSTRDMATIAKEQAKAEQTRDEADQARRERKNEILRKQMDATPRWALSPERTDGTGVYAVGFGDSDKLTLAIQKATLQAEFGLAKRYRQELSGSERLGQMDKGERASSESYTQLIDKLVANVPLVGAEVVEQEVKAVQGQFSAWVLMRISFDQLAKTAAAESGAAIDERMKAAFAELERRVRDRQEQALRLEERRQEMRIKEMKAGQELSAEQRKVEDSGAPSARKAGD